MDVPPDELSAEVLYQIAALDGIARAEGGKVSYVKPHGALYNRAAWDPVQAGAIIAAVRSYDPALPLLTLPGSQADQAATAAGLTVVAEAFADRAYNDDGTLVPRGRDGAVLTDPAVVAGRAVAMATGRQIESAAGRQIRICPRSVCIHGDTAGAVTLARSVRQALAQAGVRVAPFV
jgi:5-oxoprolinase (ATP-hydrolysing) subunit A